MSSRCKTIPLPQFPPLASNPARPGGYWRSLQQLAGDENLLRAAVREFVPGASEMPDGVARRTFLKVMGASLALATGAGCLYKKPQGQLAPATRQPEETIPGTPTFFTSACPLDGYGTGVLVESNQGRPTKIEGNPDHPASLGASDIRTQASLLDLYDIDRSREVLYAGRGDQYGTLLTHLSDRLLGKRDRAVAGRGLRILTGPITSPTFAAQLDEFRQMYPQAVLHEHDPLAGFDPAEGGGAFATPARMVYDFSKAKVIVSLDAEFLVDIPGNLRYARQFIDGRRVRKDHLEMNRLYVAESNFTLAGSMADHRLRLRTSRIPAVAQALLEAVGRPASGPKSGYTLSADQQAWVNAVADDLRSAPQGQTLVIAGPSQPAVMHALVHQINDALGNFESTLHFVEPVRVSGGKPLADLVRDMRAGAVDTLLIFGGNPVYSAPADLDFGGALKEMSGAVYQGRPANLTLHLGGLYDETSYLCQWHVPESHYLESWGDVRGFDGTTSIIQPLIAPLYNSKSMWELMEVLLNRPYRSGFEIVRGYWMAQRPAEGFDRWWTTTLQDGYVQNSASPASKPPPLTADFPPLPREAGEYEVIFRPDPCVWDGTFANNGWMQELPKPFVKLTWDNAVAISVNTAAKLGGTYGPLADGSVIAVEVQGRSVRAPVIILPGLADDVLVMTLGYGRWQGGHLLTEDGQPRGYNAYTVRASATPWHAANVTVATTSDFHMLIETRNHHAMAIEPGAPGVKPSLKAHAIADPSMSDDELDVSNRRIIRTATLDDLKKDAKEEMEKLEGSDRGKKKLSLYPEQEWDYKHGLQWAMVIDQTACIGCNACVIGCQSENNIPVVGQDEVSRQREMHWIRIDDYFGGDVDDPAVFHQPVPCMHCEDAPCELVCPVGATTHSDEGINEMTYNRCIGTRYCSNNCPYKVRRFNFLLYSDYAETKELMYNPDVTVRTRGVMEKCTYCIQRINETRMYGEKRQVELEAKLRLAMDDTERAKLQREADTAQVEAARGLQTACQQACPTEAIIFGNKRDKDAEVTKLRDEPTNYELLGELTTLPRTTYLARITNPNPRLPKPGGMA